MEKPVFTIIKKAWKRSLYHLRTNGLKRFLYLVYLHLISPLLEPLRRLAASFLTLPLKRKIRVLFPVAIVYLVLAGVTGFWYAVPLFLLLLLLAMYFKYVHVKLRAALQVRYWQAHKDELLKAGEEGYVLTVEHLGLQEEGLQALKKELEKSTEVVIAEIDQDDFLLSRFGPIAGAANIDREDFVKRLRFTLKVVALGNKVGVKKDYRGNAVRFINELEILHSLAGRCNVPAILDVDFTNLTITLSYIPGAGLREELAKRGLAMLRDRDADIMRLVPEERRLKRIEQAKRLLYQCVDRELVDSIFAELNKVHKAGICVGDIKYGNFIIERDSGEPYLIDFDLSRNYGRPGGLLWEIRRDYDIERFNLHFDTGKLTRDRMLREIKEFLKNSGGWYAPVDFGYGVAVGRIWNAEVGEGRWHYILQPNLPPLSGKRVLDLGCNNAYFSLQMLRHGAREAVGIECGEAQIKQAWFVKEGFEWADSITYNLKVIQARMEELPTMDLGRFDLVIALCTLYYMDDESMDKVIRHVSTLTDCFIIQSNINLEAHTPEINRRASVDYNVKALERNGFRVTRVVAPPGYERPLMIGIKA